jgi:histidyl-tRNA synthetase
VQPFGAAMTAAMSKTDKTTPTGRPDARLARGFRDIEAAELRQLETMIATIRSVYERYGFEPLETPVFEYTDALGKFLPDQDRPNAGVFSLQDVNPEGQADGHEPWMSLRYDLTAPLARYVAQNFDRLPKPYRRYATGSVYRNEKPGPGRYRQFTQFDADTVGTDNIAADAEMCMLAADTLEALGLTGKYVVKVSNRKVMDGVRDVLGLATHENNAKWLTVMRALDKLDRLGWKAVEQLLGPGRTDESGDRTSGAQLDPNQILALQLVCNRPIAKATKEPWTAANTDRVFEQELNDGAIIYARRDNELTLKALEDSWPTKDVKNGGLAELRTMSDMFAAAGYNDGRIEIDMSVIRGLEYYTGPVFEAELTFEVTGDDGRPVRFGSVGGGGRYDDLVARFTGAKVPATGFSIGVSRLAAALALLHKDDAKKALGPVVVLVMDKAELPRYQALAQTLRKADIRAEMYLGTAGMKPQMKYADKRGSPVVVIQGSNEREQGEVVLKDLIEGEKAAAAIKDNKEWKAARPAQITVKEADLVAEVRKILARYE